MDRFEERRSTRSPSGTVPWELLTVQDLKGKLFESDFVADDAWDDLANTYFSDWHCFLRDFTLLVLKPDAAVRRCTRTVLEYLQARGFSPVAARFFTLNRAIAAQLWRFQWNAATLDRIRLANIINQRGPSLAIVLHSHSSEGIPASVRLCQMKGSTFAERRTPSHLRSVIGMTNRMLGFIHTPDEPADVLRECGILFDRQDRRQIFSQARAEIPRHVDLNLESIISEFEKHDMRHSLDFGEVFARQSGPTKSEIQNFLDCRRKGIALRLEALEATCRRRCVDMPFWDFVTIAAESISFDRSGIAPIIDAKAFPEVASIWREHSSLNLNDLRVSS